MAFSPDRTDEFSFVLKPAAYGVGVFATHAIGQGTALRLCCNDEEEISHEAPLATIPEAFLPYCIAVAADRVIRPNDFGRMELIWYVNHSAQPNAAHRDFRYFALRDIEPGEEITIDYNSLGIPPDLREDYFRRD